MSSLFIVCQSLKLGPDLYELIVCHEKRSGKGCAMEGPINYIIRLAHFFVCFNSSANFIVYYLNGEKFRRAWLDTYGWCFGCYAKNGEWDST